MDLENLFPPFSVAHAEKAVTHISLMYGIHDISTVTTLGYLNRLRGHVIKSRHTSFDEAREEVLNGIGFVERTNAGKKRRRAMYSAFGKACRHYMHVIRESREKLTPTIREPSPVYGG